MQSTTFSFRSYTTMPAPVSVGAGMNEIPVARSDGRSVMIRSKWLALLFVLLSVSSKAQPGEWASSSAGLPVYRYTGRLPFQAVDKDGKDAQLPEDPYFLLGNYRMTLIPHVSGRYQFITAERAWARINADDPQPNYGRAEASLSIQNGGQTRKIDLLGLKSVAADPTITQRQFGVGFARYTYALDTGLHCTRTISVKPSPKINAGNPAFVVTVALTNGGSQARTLVYTERLPVNYVLMNLQMTPGNKRPMLYKARFTADKSRQWAVAALSHQATTLLSAPAENERYLYDVAPPTVFMAVKPDKGAVAATVRTDSSALATEAAVTLRPGETRLVHLVIGLHDQPNFRSVPEQVNDLFTDADLNPQTDGLFARQWKARLPDLSAEQDEVMKREMLWNAHMMEASAKYSVYYRETFIPQGTVYSYHFGDNIANRDHLQAALPACYTNPELAKSCLRYVLKHTEPDGEVKRGNSGFGYTQPGIYKESDEQLFLFNTLSEYLRITRDYAFLNERVELYPAEHGKTETVLNLILKQFVYLRDEIGVGPNGLVKILNSDWSDSFFLLYSPNRYIWSAESHLNSAMVLAVFPKLITQLDKAGGTGATPLVKAMKDYHDAVEKAYLNDLGNRTFSARAYLNAKLRFGVEDVTMEPQGYLLQIPSLPAERKKEIYRYVYSKLGAPEKLGLRNREKKFWDNGPHGEDGGIWYSLEYPVVAALADFDKAEGWRLMRKFSFANFATHFPQYWVGHWTAPDEMNSSMLREGLYEFWLRIPDMRKAFQGYCSHPHTWPLYCYFKLNE